MRQRLSEPRAAASALAAHHRRRTRAAQAPGRLSLHELVQRSGAARTAFGKRTGGADETRLLQLAPKVRRLVGHSADRLEQPSSLRHGETFGQQTDGDVRPPELAAQAFDRIDDDALMVEAER